MDGGNIHLGGGSDNRDGYIRKQLCEIATVQEAERDSIKKECECLS